MISDITTQNKAQYDSVGDIVGMIASVYGALE